MVTWFTVIGLLGAINIWAAPAIVAALDRRGAPFRGGRSGDRLHRAVMGGVFLALTGAEALYADMGHVGRSRHAPRLVRPGLAGAAAELLRARRAGPRRPQGHQRSIHKLAPHWALIPLVQLAALATIIASQALISGVFSLTRQAMQMGLCPAHADRADVKGKPN